MNSLLANPASNDFGIIVLGAVFVVIGTMIWSWKPVLRHVLQSRQNQGDALVDCGKVAPLE